MSCVMKVYNPDIQVLAMTLILSRNKTNILFIKVYNPDIQVYNH
jgi:hypothetical protein